MIVLRERIKHFSQEFLLGRDNGYDRMTFYISFKENLEVNSSQKSDRTEIEMHKNKLIIRKNVQLTQSVSNGELVQ